MERGVRISRTLICCISNCFVTEVNTRNKLGLAHFVSLKFFRCLVPLVCIEENFKRFV